MVIDGIGGDFIKPVAKLPLCAFEPAEILNDLEKHRWGNIFSYLPIEKPMHAISKHGVVMPTIKLSERHRVTVGMGD